MKFLENINKEEYEAFVKNSPFGHFMQSYDFGQIRKQKNFTAHYVGMKDGHKLVCTALLLEKKLPFHYCYFYCPRGYVIDFSNRDLVKTFTSELRKFAKKKKAIFIKIDPAIKLHNLDSDGNVKEEVNNYDLVEFLKKNGYRHLGYNVGFEHEQPRFTFRIPLTQSFDTIYQRMHPTTKKILNKGNQYQLEIYKGNEKDLDDFYLTMKETSKREGIVQAPLSYYRSFYQIFHHDHMSDLYIVKADPKKLKQVMQKKIEKVTQEITKLETTTTKNKDKVQNKLYDLKKQLEKLNKDNIAIQALGDEKIVLSSIITVKYGNGVWTVHGGNNSQLMWLNANYLCYYTILKDAYDEGYQWLDCFGASGIANPKSSDPIFGLHFFKKRLGGEYIEFIGEFDFIVHPFLYWFFITFIPIHRWIAKKKGKKN